jgi:pentatricopeptide repeat protein
MEDGYRCLRSPYRQDIVTWTSMISGFVQNELFEKALRLFQEFLCYGLKPDLFTISSVMNACASLAVARTGEQIQCLATKSGFNRFTVMGNSCIHMYARSGDVDAATLRFQEMESRDVVSWSALISSHAQHGCARLFLMRLLFLVSLLHVVMEDWLMRDSGKLVIHFYQSIHSTANATYFVTHISYVHII